MEYLDKIKIVSTGSYLPSKNLTNFDLEKMVETSNDWIVTRTGIENRRIVDGETTSDMAVFAARKAIEKVNYDVSKIDLIIVASITGEYKSPAVANLVQAKLSLNEQEVTTFDINAACSGFIYALNVASKMLLSPAYHSALVIGVETLSKLTNYQDRNTCVLFGDGAGAVIVEKGTSDHLSYFYTSSKGDLDKVIVVEDKIAMEGKKVYQFASRIIEKSIRKVLEDASLTLDDIDVIIPHQANLRIIESAAKSLKLDMSKFYINIGKYGNTSSASIPIALDEYVRTCTDHKKTKRIIIVGFGGGLTWGAALLTI